MLQIARKPVSQESSLAFRKVALLICPTGTYCREDRCQSYFKFHLVPSLRAPLEECQMAGAVSSAHGEALIIDAPGSNIDDKQFLEKLRNFEPDLLILSVTFGTLEDDLRYAKTLSALYPDVAIGLRGAPCYVQAESILQKHLSIDFCLRGDYELAIDHVIRFGYEDSPGTVFRGSDDTITACREFLKASTLDELPLPDRSTLTEENYKVRFFGEKQATIHVQRGCPFPCTYCLVHTVSGSKARHRSPESIIHEIQELTSKGTRFFYLRAETFTLKKSWVLALCKAIEEQCPGIHWVTTTRVELVDAEILAAMKAAGCYGVSFGIDVASKAIAEKVKKHFDKKEVIHAMDLCRQHGIISLAYIMIGFLWDTEETVAEAERYVLEARPDLLTVHFAHPYPGTKYYETIMSHKPKMLSLHAQSEPAHDTTTLSTAHLERAAQQMLRKHYLRVSVLYSLFRKLTTLGIQCYLPRVFSMRKSV